MINCYDAALAIPVKSTSRVERVDWVGIRHRCGVRARNAAGNTKPAFGDHHGFTKGNSKIAIFRACAAICWDGAGDSRGSITSSPALH